MALLRRLWHWIEADRDGELTRAQEAALTEDHGEPPSPERRRFFSRLGLALGGLTALIAGIPVVSMLLSPVLRRDPHVWREIGAVDDFRIGETLKISFLDPSPLPWAGFAGRSAAWLRRVGPVEFEVFSIYCTHVGCPVTWLQRANLFLCPCHGGAFYRDGSVASGPPSKPLDRIPVRVRNGQVELRTSPVPLPE